jgi:GNAT superfamily N-acetyltransferase
MTATLRHAVPEDRALLVAMHGEFVAHFAALSSDGWPERPDAEAIVRLSGLGFRPVPLCHTIMAEIDGWTAGLLTYHFGVYEGLPSLFVADLYVREAARGSGVGSLLLNEVRSIAISNELTQMVWTVWRENAHAIAFYQRFGAHPHHEEMVMLLPVAPGSEGGGQ